MYDWGFRYGKGDGTSATEGLEDSGDHCRWIERKESSCAVDDACFKIHSSKDSCTKDKKCQWEDFEGGECSQIQAEGDPNDPNGGPNMNCGMITDGKKDTCEAEKGCMWKTRDIKGTPRCNLQVTGILGFMRLYSTIHAKRIGTSVYDDLNNFTP